MKRFSPPPASLPGVLTRYLVLTVALGALAALAAVGCALWQLDWLPF